MQRRLSQGVIKELIDDYRGGMSIDVLARRYGIHRTTVIHHLDQSGVARRSVVRKMNDKTVTRAAVRYREGASLAIAAAEFGVHTRTLAREFRRAGVAIRV